MNRSDLIARLAADHAHLRRQDAERLVATVLQEIADALRRGQRVELRGFGTFSIKDRAPRTARNPRLGEKVQVGRRRVAHFKSSKVLNQRLNDELEPPPA